MRFLHGQWLLEHLHDDVGEAVPAELRVSQSAPPIAYRGCAPKVYGFTVKYKVL